MERIKQALERAKAERQTTSSGGMSPSRPASGSAGGKLPAQIEYTNTPVFKPDPEVLRANRVLSNAVLSDPAKDAFRMLRTRVLQKLVENSWNSFAITSPTGEVGKTLTATNLAISLAREVNHTVLLVDADLRRPSIHKMFGYSPDAGIGDYLTRNMPVEKLLFNPGVDRLVILPGTERFDNSSELLSSPTAANLVSELRRRYPERIVIFDLPPTLAVDDALAFSPLVDAYLMVLGEGESTSDELEAALEVLKDLPLLGTVFNKSTGTTGGYYY